MRCFCDITDFTFVDLLFLESSEVLFRVSVALLEEHQDQLLYCDSFEEIMEYLKVSQYIIPIFYYLLSFIINYKKWKSEFV